MEDIGCLVGVVLLIIMLILGIVFGKPGEDCKIKYRRSKNERMEME